MYTIEHIRTWAHNGNGTYTSPDGVHVFIHPTAWVGEGARVGAWASVGEGAWVGERAWVGAEARIGEGAWIGERARVGKASTFVADLGVTDSYRKTLCAVDGVAWIAAGCRWFALKDALQHWGEHAKDRRESYACMVYACALAEIHGLKLS